MVLGTLLLFFILMGSGSFFHPMSKPEKRAADRVSISIWSVMMEADSRGRPSRGSSTVFPCFRLTANGWYGCRIVWRKGRGNSTCFWQTGCPDLSLICGATDEPSTRTELSHRVFASLLLSCAAIIFTFIALLKFDI